MATAKSNLDQNLAFKVHEIFEVLEKKTAEEKVIDLNNAEFKRFMYLFNPLHYG